MSVELVDLALVKTDGGTQPRANLELLVVQEYVDAMERGDTFPPVKLVYDGNAYWPYDGFHRIEACRASNRPMIRAEVLQGTVEDARWMSCAANATHGLRRTNLDKRRAVVTALKHERAVRLSDRKIADHCGVSDKTVAAIRAELVAGAEIPHLETRVGQDGKSYPAKPSKPEPTWPEPDADGYFCASNACPFPFALILKPEHLYVKVYVLQIGLEEWLGVAEWHAYEVGIFPGAFSLADPVAESEEGAVFDALKEAWRAMGRTNGSYYKDRTVKGLDRLRQAVANELNERAFSSRNQEMCKGWVEEFAKPESQEEEYPQPNERGDYLPWEKYDWEESRPVIGVEQSRNIWIRELVAGPDRWAVGWAIRLGNKSHIVHASRETLSDCAGQQAAREMVEWIEERFTGFPVAVQSEARAVLRWLGEDFAQYSQEVDLEDPEPVAEPEPEEPKLKLVKPSAAFCRQTRDAIELLADNAGDWPGVGVNLRVDVSYEKVLRAMKALTLIRDAIRPARAS